MAEVDEVLDEAGLKNPRVREYVHHWAELTGAARVEVVTAADDARLVQEALDAGELRPAGEGRLLLAQLPQGHGALGGAHDRGDQ